MVKLEVPVSSLWSLFTDGEGRIEQRAILEIPLISILHLHDELLAILILAIHIEDSLAFSVDIPHMLTVQVLHVLDDLKTFKQRVQKVDEQILVRLCPKDALETEIGQQAYISFFYLSHNLSPFKRLNFVQTRAESSSLLECYVGCSRSSFSKKMNSNAKIHFSPHTAKFLGFF